MFEIRIREPISHIFEQFLKLHRRFWRKQYNELTDEIVIRFYNYEVAKEFVLFFEPIFEPKGGEND